jgi:hypothetical protein
MDPRFEQFIQERKSLLNVSPATRDWYKHSLKWLCTASPSQDELKDTVLGHSPLEMTRRYANLMTEDLQQIHEKVSLLSGG